MVVRVSMFDVTLIRSVLLESLEENVAACIAIRNKSRNKQRTRKLPTKPLGKVDATQLDLAYMSVYISYAV